MIHLNAIEHIFNIFPLKVRLFKISIFLYLISHFVLCVELQLHPWPAMKRSFSTANLQAFAPKSPESDAETLDLSTGLPLSEVGLRPRLKSSEAETEDGVASAVLLEFLKESGDEYDIEDANKDGSELISLNDPCIEAQALHVSQEAFEHDLQPDTAFRAAHQIGLNILALDPYDASNLPIRSWREAVRNVLDLETAQWKRPLQLGTLCSGLGTPHLALVLLGIPVNEVFAADLKPCCSKVAANANIQPDHYFDDAASILNGSGWCRVHSTTCEVPLWSLDLFVAGFPCSPFSTQRACRFKRPWHTHPEAPVMKTVCEGISKEQPRLALLENVVGFLREPRHCKSQQRCLLFFAFFKRGLSTLELFAIY